MAYSFDTETNGLYRWQGHRAFCYSTCDEEGRKRAYRLSDNRKRADELWNDPNVDLVFHNAKFDLGMSVLAGIPIPYRRKLNDTSIMSHLLQNDHPNHKLKQLAWELARYSMDDEKRVKRETRGHKGDYSTASWEAVKEYAANDAERTMLLYQLWKPIIDESPQLTELYETEMDLLWTSYRIEECGVRVIPHELGKLMMWVDEVIEKDVALLTKKGGRGFNPNTPADVVDVLFNKCGLPVKSYTKTKQACTDKDALMELLEEFPGHPVIEAVMRYRSYSRGRSAFESYNELMDDEGRIHCSINTCGARTGRESSENPNMQNVSKSKALRNLFPIPARRAFGPGEGYVNYHLDYSGQELRLACIASGDERMSNCLREGRDGHDYGARMFYGSMYTDMPEGKDKKVRRDAAKNGDFGKIYGANYVRMASTLSIPVPDARVGVKRWEEEFPRLTAIGGELAAQARRDGYIETSFGRRIHMPDARKAYAAINYRCQGDGAEIIKRAQNRVDRYLHDHTGDEVRIVLPVHDEIIIQYPRKRMKDSRDLLRKVVELMTDFSQLAVPMEVEVEVSTYSWERLKEVKLT